MKFSGKWLGCAAAVGGLALLIGSCARPHPPRAALRPPPPVRGTPPAQPPVARTAELRGVWISDTAHLDWNQATANLQRAGFNAMYVNLASAGGAFYPSSVLPNLADAANDPVARGLQLAHQRGLAVHAKLITLFMFKAPPNFQQRLIREHRVMRDPQGRPALQTGHTWLCPSQPANRALLASALSELLARYPVDGVQFDYLRFFEEPTCFCEHCRHEFEQSIGQHLKRWPRDAIEGPYADAFRHWQRDLINDWVRDLTGIARTRRPGIILSAAVFHDLERGREDRAQDWQYWLQHGWLDYVCTMNYSPDLREFETRLRKQQAWAPRVRVVPGIGSWKLDQMDQLLAQINVTRKLAAPGFVLFSYDDAATRNFLPTLARQ